MRGEVGQGEYIEAPSIAQVRPPRQVHASLPSSDSLSGRPSQPHPLLVIRYESSAGAHVVPQSGWTHVATALYVPATP